MFNRYKDKTLESPTGGLGRRSFGLVGLYRDSRTFVLCRRSGSARFYASALQTQSPSQTPDNGKPKQDVPAEAGGPGDNVGPYAIPKKKAEDAPPPPPVAPKKLEDMPDYSLKVNVPLVNVDVLVTTKDGQFIPGLKKDNFRILEDGVPQKVTHFNVSQAPITAVLLVEFASTTWPFLVDPERILRFCKYV